jgi:PIN domain nuclease of toxin-antitoxin system
MKSEGGYLIDTHVFLWAISSVDKLSEKALSVLQDNLAEIYLSKVSYWEICLKISKGKLKLKRGWQTQLEEERKKNRFKWLEVEPRHCEGILLLPELHKDPFDRMLISQSICESLCLISCDEKIAQYSLNILW